MSKVYRFRRNRAKETKLRRGRTVRTRWEGLLGLVLISTVLTALVVLGGAVLIYRAYAVDLKPPDEVIGEANLGTSRVLDRSGQLLYEFLDPNGQLRNPVPLEEISPYLIAATIATEDASYYDNPGVNPKGLLRAFQTNLPKPLGDGIGQGVGGSSITQQLVKNIYISPEDRFDRKLTRKIKEAVLAIELKRHYSDDQILEWYLNQIPYGGPVNGAEAAAQWYFGKHAKDLSLAEAAALAGIPQSPLKYMPNLPENRDRAKQRQLEVLGLMQKHLREIQEILPNVTVEEIEAAKTQELTFVQASFSMKAPHFVLYIRDQITDMCEKGMLKLPPSITCDKAVYRGGLTITTTLDLGLQQIAERTVEEQVSTNEERTGGHNGALVAIFPSTGEILAYVGSRSYWRDDIAGNVDIATSLKSHGSTMKVFTYLTAFKEGWVPSTVVQDAPLTLNDGGRTKKVENWNFSYQGNITVRKALAESVNTAAVRTVMEVGVDDMRKTAHELGITDLRDDRYCGPTITLGSCEVKLLDMVYAYSVIANNGVMKGTPTVEDLPGGFRQLDPWSITKITDSDGRTVFEQTKPEEKQVIDPAYAYMIADILSRDAITWSRMTIDRPAGTKTGTSEDFRDNVVMGFTPGLVAGVWMGNADNTPMADGTFSSAGTGPMWRTFMLRANEYMKLPSLPFVAPDDVVKASCGGHEEIFKKGSTPAKPGACRAPGEGPTPTFPPRPTPQVSPTPEPTTVVPTATPKPTQTVPPKPTPTEPASTEQPDSTGPTPRRGNSSGPETQQEGATPAPAGGEIRGPTTPAPDEVASSALAPP